MKLSLIIPIYNEADHLELVLQKLDTLVLPLEKELIFIDDCSSDNSLEILNKFNFISQSKIIIHEKNQGKGKALQHGIAEATGDFVGIQDADFEYDMDDINSLIENLVTDKADIVYGSRFKKSAKQVHRTFHYLTNRILTILSNLFSGLYLTDMETCYKFFKREIIQNIIIESNRFGFEPEITAKIANLKCRIIELPIYYYPRNYIEGKKITWKDGLAALWHIVNFNIIKNEKFYYKNEMPMKYITKTKQWL